LTGYAADWLERKERRLKPATRRLYKTLLKQRVVPVLGTLYADVVVRADVEEWVLWAEDQRTPAGKLYADATLERWWSMLSVLLKDMAADLGIPDPTVRVSRPTSRKELVREQRTLSLDELGRLLEEVAASEPQWLAEVTVLAYTGIRAGELYALHWGDVENDRLVVRRGVSDGEITDTKTHRPREVYLPPVVAGVLADHRREMIANQHRGLSSGLVFPNVQGGVRRQWSIQKPLNACAVAIGLEQRVTPQVLRRTYNTLLAQAGVDRVVLRSQMGHVSERMTQLYAGVSIESKAEAARKVFRLGELVP